jgi:SAM-dependent methyltransferase
MSGFRDHFAPQAPQYAAFRPTYPADFIARIAALAPHHDLAWDVGTGSGQAAVLLARHFTRVHATDASGRQLQHAVPHPGVEYVEAPADTSGLPECSVDLVAVAQALHWFPQERFHAEVRRVLRPGGVLAAWSYGLLTVDPAVDAVIHWFYETRIGRYWPPERMHVERRYADLPFPYRELAMEDGQLDARLTRSQVTGFIATWSAVRHAREAEGADPVEEFEARLARVWPDDEVRAVRWPLVVRAGRHDAPRPER